MAEKLRNPQAKAKLAEKRERIWVYAGEDPTKNWRLRFRDKIERNIELARMTDSPSEKANYLRLRPVPKELLDEAMGLKPAKTDAPQILADALAAETAKAEKPRRQKRADAESKPENGAEFDNLEALTTE